VVKCSHTSEEHTVFIFRVTETVPVDGEMMKKICHLYKRVQGIQPIVAMAGSKRGYDCPELMGVRFSSWHNPIPSSAFSIAVNGQIPSTCHTELSHFLPPAST